MLQEQERAYFMMQFGAAGDPSVVVDGTVMDDDGGRGGGAFSPSFYFFFRIRLFNFCRLTPRGPPTAGDASASLHVAARQRSLPSRVARIPNYTRVEIERNVLRRELFQRESHTAWLVMRTHSILLYPPCEDECELVQ